jgi:hypothetical protein
MIQGLAVLAAGMQLADGITGFVGAQKQSKAYERQAAFQLQLGQEKAQWAEQLAQAEADLILARGEDEAEIAEWNAAQADANARFAARAGATELMDSERSWSEQIKNVTAQFAASGVLLSDTPTAVLAEQYAETAKEAHRIQLNTSNAVARARGDADIFTLQGARARAAAQRQASARLQAGAIDSRSSLLQAMIGADASRAQAQSARIAGYSSLFQGFGSAASTFGGYLDKRFTPSTTPIPPVPVPPGGNR